MQIKLLYDSISSQAELFHQDSKWGQKQEKPLYTADGSVHMAISVEVL